MQSKLIEAKVYAILMETSKISYLSAQMAHSLEEAASKATKEFYKINKQLINEESSPEIKIGMYTIRTIEELETGKLKLAVKEDSKEFDSLLNEFKEVLDEPKKEPRVETAVEKKNRLMKTIIDTRDKFMLEANKENLTKEEYKYLRELLGQ